MRALLRPGVVVQPTLRLPRAPPPRRPLGKSEEDAGVLAKTLRPFPFAARRVVKAFPASALQCTRRSTDGWCLLQIPDRDIDSLAEINERARLLSAWVETGGPEPGCLGGADAAARDVLKRSNFRNRKRRAKVVLKPLGGQQPATVKHARFDPLKQKKKTRATRRHEWLDRSASPFARGGCCAQCIIDVLNMSGYDMYQVSFFHLLLCLLVLLLPITRLDFVASRC
jgi:hypothetical protein